MSYKAKYKSKKALRTTLGTAAHNNNLGKSVDVSHLRKPIQTSLFGLRQVLSLLDTATDEVRSYITYECDLMYECRICRTIFRSLANFILHKREYCKDKFSNLTDQIDFETTNTIICYDNEDEKMKRKEKHKKGLNGKKDLSAVLKKLEAKQKSHEIFQKVVNLDLTEEDNIRMENKRDEVLKRGDITLQEINKSVNGVFQTLIRDAEHPKNIDELMKSEVMEIHSILNSDEVILGPDGKIVKHPIKVVDPLNAHEANLICKLCKQHFSTKKTLTHHIKYKHNNTKVVYLCPEGGCKGSMFANTWSVFRHLFKVHRKTPVQIKRMRSLIQSSVVKRGQVVQVDEAKEWSKNSLGEKDEQNQWLNNFEGDVDLQMCGGCGKRFERKAALHSHSQLCLKRQAVCNSTRDNKQIDEFIQHDKRLESQKPIQKPVVVGAQKRKPSVLRKHIKRIDEKIVPPSIEVVEKCDEIVYVDPTAKENVFEPDKILHESPLQDPLRCSPEIYCVSDDDDEEPDKKLSLKVKAAPFVNMEELKCVPCSFKFRKLENLMKHMSSHFKWFKFQCVVCLFKSYDRGTCENHIKKCHNNQQNAIISLTLSDTLKHSVEFQELCFPPVELDDSDEDAAPDLDKTNVKDPSVQKMIMEVIFGNVSASNESSSRPVRNRVVPKKDDFVYDEDIKRLSNITKPMKVYGKKRKFVDDDKEQKF